MIQRNIGDQTKPDHTFAYTRYILDACIRQLLFHIFTHTQFIAPRHFGSMWHVTPPHRFYGLNPRGLAR